MNAIEFSNVSFRYSEKDKRIFRNFSLEIPSRSITTVTGENGSGKTTLLYLICGIIPKSIHGLLEGAILLHGEDYSTQSLPQLAPVASILMQEIEWQLHFPSVEQEIVFGPENLCLPREEIGSRLQESLAMFNIAHLQHKDTYSLSYGQKKLVALSALFALRPSILVLDEPLNGLSGESAKLVINFIHLYRGLHGTVVLTSHDEELLSISDQVIHLDTSEV